MKSFALPLDLLLLVLLFANACESLTEQETTKERKAVF